MLESSDIILKRARHLIRAHHTGTLLSDGSGRETRVLLDPRSGDFLVEFVEEDLGADDTTIAMPRDSFDCPLRVSVELIGEPDEEQRDRFVAYHTPAQEPKLAAARVSFVKIDSGDVFEPDDLELINPFVSGMGALCRVCNEDRAALAELCRVSLGSAIQDSVCVGVDPNGIDIRAHGGVVRIPFAARVSDIDEAERTLRAMIGATRA